MISNKQIAQAFKNAVPYLDPYGDFGVNSSYICHAICLGNPAVPKTAAYVADTIGKAAIEVVDSRLGGITMLTWLITQAGVPEEDITEENIFEHRTAWLKILIEEFDS